MIIRDINGKINIIIRKDCKNEKVYNQKIYNIMQNYCNKYTNSFLIPPKIMPTPTPIINKINRCHINENSSDSDEN